MDGSIPAHEATGHPVGVEDKSDFGGTTAVIAYVRSRVTPKILWSIIAGLVGVLVVAITWIVNTQSDVHQLNKTVTQLEEQRKTAAADRDQDRELLHKIDTAVQVMGGKVDDIATEVNRQREWRERITEVAESPPHAMRKRR